MRIAPALVLAALIACAERPVSTLDAGRDATDVDASDDIALDAQADPATDTTGGDTTDASDDTATDATDDTPPDARADTAIDVSGDAPTDAPSDSAADGDSGCEPPAPTLPGQVRTELSTVQGELEDGVWRWLAIPYAAPPVGELRWEPPQPPACDESVRDATSWGAACPQLDGDAPIGDEDCLTLNVFAPDGAAPEGGWPVLVFVHGGGHVQGSAGQTIGGVSSARIYDGGYLAQAGPAVVVTVQYRLGALGWLAYPALEDDDGSLAMWGTLDQRAGLQWVQQNIGAFGGDAGRVMLFGESAGGVSTCVHVASSGSAGLFHAAAIESATCTAEARGAAVTRHQRLVGASRCGDAADVVGCLRGLDWHDVLTDLPGSPGLGNVRIGGGDESWGPIVDGVVLADTPAALIDRGQGNDVPVIIGSNAAELEDAWVIPVPDAATYEALVRATFFSLGASTVDTLLATYPATAYPTPRDAAVALWSDAQFNCIARRSATVLSRANTAPTYHYWFTQVFEARSGPVPPAHGNELPYVFGTLDDIPLLTIPDSDLRVSQAAMGYWTRFAATGDPNGADAPAWASWDVESQPTMRLEDPPGTAASVLPNCDVWDDLYDGFGLP